MSEKAQFYKKSYKVSTKKMYNQYEFLPYSLYNKSKYVFVQT